MVKEHWNLSFVSFIEHVRMLKDEDPKEILKNKLQSHVNSFLSKTYLNQ